MTTAVEPTASLYPFVLTEDQEHLRREIRAFAAREIAPHVSAWDEASEFPLEVIKKLAGMGLLGVIFPPEYGGAGLGYVDYVLAIEELSAVDGSIGLTVAAHNSLGTNHIFLAGTEAQKKKYFLKLATGEWLAAWALTEPGSGSDAAQRPHHRRQKRGDRYVLNGNKTFITNGRYADVLVIIAVTDKSKGTHGLSAFIVEKGTKGFRPGKKENKLGLRASDTSELIFEDCEIPAENLLGAEGEGFIDAMRVLDGGRISIAALALGIGRGALDAALKYVKERRQFGKAIAEFQGIQWKLADMATELDAARLLTQRAAVLKDAGRKITRESAMAKLFASEVAVRICDDSRATLRRLRLHQGLSRRKVLSRRQTLHHRRRHQRDSAHGHRPRNPQSLSLARIIEVVAERASAFAGGAGASGRLKRFRNSGPCAEAALWASSIGAANRYPAAYSGNVGKELEVFAADKFLIVRRSTVDFNNVHIVEGGELLLHCPDKLFAFDANTLSVSECHGPMLGTREEHNYPENGEPAGQNSNRGRGTMVIPFPGEEHFREKMARNLLRWYTCNYRLFLEGVPRTASRNLLKNKMVICADGVGVAGWAIKWSNSSSARATPGKGCLRSSLRRPRPLTFAA